MDLSKFRLDDTMPMTVRNPVTGEESDMVIFFHHPSSKVGRNVLADFYRNRKEGDDQLPLDEYFIPRLMTGWENYQEGKKVIEFSLDAAIDLIQKHSWICVQANAHFRNGEYSPKQ